MQSQRIQLWVQLQGNKLYCKQDKFNCKKTVLLLAAYSYNKNLKFPWIRVNKKLQGKVHSQTNNNYLQKFLKISSRMTHAFTLKILNQTKYFLINISVLKQPLVTIKVLLLAWSATNFHTTLCKSCTFSWQFTWSTSIQCICMLKEVYRTATLQ